MPPALPMPPGRTPRLWQTQALHAIRQAWVEGVSAQVVHAATGTGKGTLLAGVAAGARRAGWRVLILVPRTVLVDDIADRIRILGEACGVVQGGRHQIRAPIVVATYQSLQGRRLRDVGPFDLVITDECHHATAPSYRKIFARVEEARGGRRWLHLGLTATPFRSDGKGGTLGLGEVYGAVVYSHGIVEAIAAGDLVPPRGIRVETHVDVSACRVTSGGDYDEADLIRLVDTPARNRLIAEKHLEHARGRSALAFCVGVDHAEHLAQAMRDAGISAQAVHSRLDSQECARRLAAYQSGQIEALTSADMILEGFDAPRASVLHRARPTMSRVLAVQMVGRGLRTCEEIGKRECLVLDYVDDGVPLELHVESDLTDAAARVAKRAPTLHQPGDMVRHRHSQPPGIGTVLAASDVLCTVEWPDDGERMHGHSELAQVRADDPDAPPPEIVISGASEYRLALLPGQAASGGLGWYGYQGELSTGGRARDGARMTALLRPLANGGWSLWICRTRGRDRTAHKAAGGRDAVDLQRRAEGLLRGWGVRPSLDASWRSQPASDAQIRTLGRMRAAIPTDCTAGEASHMLDAITSREAVRQTIASLRSDKGRRRYSAKRRAGAT